jgi:cobalamin biosynthetic protein CobC
MMPSPDLAPLAHGGDLDAARKLFPGAPEPFLDLSTGINPNPYPIPQLPLDAFARLPQPDALARLTKIAAETYDAPSASHVVVAPGSQIAMALCAGLVAPGRAIVLGPAYAEHARMAALAGHEVVEVADVDELASAALAIVVNPNNPDGRILAKDTLLSLAESLQRRAGLLVVDEAFMDVGPHGASLGNATDRENVVVLRSFGKFYGLPGLRLSFALASPSIAERLAAALGPWPVSGAALAIGTEALADTAWRTAGRASLEGAAHQLDQLLADAGLHVIGGTLLFRLARHSAAATLFQQLGEAGIFVRRFEREPYWLRFGLPGADDEWQRLAAVLGAEAA